MTIARRIIGAVVGASCETELPTRGGHIRATRHAGFDIIAAMRRNRVLRAINVLGEIIPLLFISETNPLFWLIYADIPSFF